MLDPYIKLHASFILMDERVKALSNKNLGCLIRCLALASNSDGSIPADPKALGKLLGISTKEARALMPMLINFFSDYQGISPEILEKFQHSLEKLFKNFGIFQDRLYSNLVLESLGPYSQFVNNNREIAAKGAGREHPKPRLKTDTARSTVRSTTCTSTNKAVVSLFVNGEEDIDPAGSEVQTEHKEHASVDVVEHPPVQDGETITRVMRENVTPTIKIAMAWNGMVKAVGRADLKVRKKDWAEIGPLIEESLRKTSEQEHLDGIAYAGTWAPEWWRDANKMSFLVFLKKVPVYAKKFRATPSTSKSMPGAEKRPHTVSVKTTPDDLAVSLARHPRGTEIWEKVQGLFPRIQLADAAVLMEVLVEGKSTPDDLLHSAEHKFQTVTGPEFMPSLGKWLTEGGYLLHAKPLNAPTKIQGKLRQDITGGVGIMGQCLEAKKQQLNPEKETTND